MTTTTPEVHSSPIGELTLNRETIRILTNHEQCEEDRGGTHHCGSHPHTRCQTICC
jgi:hypothetical protein